MILVSGTAMWLPLYALILWLVWRREGWRRTLLFAAAIVLAIVLADMAAGIFKHSGPLKGLWADFPPRWRPMFTPSLEGLEIAPDTLMRWRFEGHATPGIVHVPEGRWAGNSAPCRRTPPPSWHCWCFRQRRSAGAGSRS